MQLNVTPYEIASRFARYASVFTQSEEGCPDTPSTECQRDLASMLADELREMGMADVFYDEEHCYVYATLPGNIPVNREILDRRADTAKKRRENAAPILGFVAHMDTSAAVPARKVSPRIIEDYDGGAIVLNKELGIVSDPAQMPDLPSHKGETIVVTDGTSVLGGDDKAGITQIMEAMRFFLRHPEYPHGTAVVCFTPDEEVGNGTLRLDPARFTADYAYTVDAGAAGELEYENFNAASVQIAIRGRSTHPGAAKGRMKNALLIAMELNSLLPADEIPARTEGYEGFFHLNGMKGITDSATMSYLIRDHDHTRFEERKKQMLDAGAEINRRYGDGTATVSIEDSYYNMAEKVIPHMHLIENAKKAILAAGLTPKVQPIRGGTDGCKLSYEGIPCPNLGTGAFHIHSRYEYVSAQEMLLGTQILIRILSGYAAYELDVPEDAAEDGKQGSVEQGAAKAGSSGAAAAGAGNPAGEDDETARQYFFLDRAKDTVAKLSQKLGRTPTAHVVTFGCQMNAKDSEKLLGILTAAGFAEAPTEDADFVLFNTCTVRDNADQRLFGRLGRLSHNKKLNPEMKIALCGCMMQEASNVEKIKKSYPFVDLVFGTHNLYRFPEYLCGVYEQDGTIIDIWDRTDRIVEDLPSVRKYSYKSGVNIMFGCNNFCTYCIVPYVRGRERSRSMKDIVRETERLAADGVKEIMLLGQNVNSYGHDLAGEATFAQLLTEVAQVPGIERVRFMTPHPKDFGDDVIKAIAAHENIARHVHLPLQSGSSRILKAMNRHYTKEQYLELVRKIREGIPDVSITTDIIVGFPGETKEDVDDTIDVVRKAAFDNAYTFIYSPRRGTPAARMEQVPEEEKHRQFDRVLAAVQETARMQAQRLQGRIMTGLVEEVNSQDASLVSARLSGNMIVHIPGDASMIGSFIPIRLEECHGFYYFGTAAGNEK